MSQHPPCSFDTLPSDLALIECHLRPWLTSPSPSFSPSPFVHVADLYAAGPAALARTFPPAVACDGDRAWYFLTRLRRKSTGHRRFQRAVDSGAGWWHSEARERPVVDAIAADGSGPRQVGRRQFLVFMREDERGVRVRTGWIMAELRVGDGRGHEDEDLRVLCKVYRSPRHPGGGGCDAQPKALVYGRRKEDEEEAGGGEVVSDGAAAASGDSDEATSVAGDEGGSASPPRKRKLAAAGDGEPRKRTHCCLRCGCHLDAAPQPSVQGGRTPAWRDPTFYYFI